MIRIVILGSGNVAQHLYAAFYAQKSVSIIQCYNRQGIPIHKDQKNKAVTNNLSELVEADIYIIAVSDDAISEISKKLPFTNRLVVHTSGGVPMTAIHGTHYRGVLYPLQTFSLGKEVEYTTIPFCVEAEREKDVVLLKKLATTISRKVYDITSAQRNVLHVAAVFVNNFTNHMFTVGHEICEEHGVPFEILHPLIQETAKKAEMMLPKNAQTGPAIRQDDQTIKRHLDIINTNSQKELYTILTKAIQSTYGKEL